MMTATTPSHKGIIIRIIKKIIDVRTTTTIIAIAAMVVADNKLNSEANSSSNSMKSLLLKT